MADKLVILVEGTGDREFLYHLLNHHGFTRNYLVKPKEGISNVLGVLGTELKASDLQSLGLIVDADIDLAARWASLQAVLLDSGYANVPTQPDRDGTIVEEHGHPRVGIWLMPDNELPGVLEDFARLLVPTGDALWEQAARCIDGIDPAERLFPNQYLIKAQIHTWLAWQEEPGTQLGLAITRRYLDPESPVAQRFVEWVRRLFRD